MMSLRSIHFLRDLAANNSKEWFEDHRADYDEVRANLAEIAQALLAKAGSFDRNLPADAFDPARCVSRIHRDMRFAKGKPPYKTDQFIMLGASGPGDVFAPSYFVHVEPGHCYAGGGMFTPNPAQLGRIRERIAHSYKTWTDIVESDALRKLIPDGLTAPSTLKNMPAGYDPAHPGAAYLRMKGYCIVHPISDARMRREETLDEIVLIFKQSRPFVDFLKSAIGAAP